MLFVAALTVVLCAAIATASQASAGLHAMAYRGAVLGVLSAVVCLVTIASVWQLIARNRVDIRAPKKGAEQGVS